MGGFRSATWGWALLAFAMPLSRAFYLPGVAIQEYKSGDKIDIKVNAVKSVRTAIPYDYYSLMFCRPEVKGKVDYKTKIKHEPENLGEILFGDSIKPSAYRAHMMEDVTCRKLCVTKPDMFRSDKDQKKKKRKRDPVRRLKQRIDDEYRGHLILDNLPVAEVLVWENANQDRYYKRGYPLGRPGNRTHPTVVNNHLRLTIKYHKPPTPTRQSTRPRGKGSMRAGIETSESRGEGGYRIVGFNVLATSVASDVVDRECSPGREFSYWEHPPQILVANDTKKGPKAMAQRKHPLTTRVSWSYSVKWEEDPEVPWVSRWDHYLHSSEATDDQIHWFSIVNSSLVVLVLSAMVASIMARTLHRDFNRYNNPENEFEAEEETGWKLVHGDVFREPENSRWLQVFAGVGVQMLAVAMVTLAFACLGFLSPANRGAFFTALILLYAFAGILGGYVTGILQRLHHEVNWTTPLLTALLVPGQAFGVFLLLNLVMACKQASNAVPFSTLLTLIIMWFVLTVPLVLVGAKLGFRPGAIMLEPPVEVNAIPRFVPPQPWFLNPRIAIPCAGLIPFMACSLEVAFILSSLWQNKFYYVFGFFTVVFMILIVTCAETAIVGTYFQLCFGDYHWWWRSFFLSASCGAYLFAYSCHYFYFYLHITKIWSVVLYFSYMLLASYLFSILCGAIGLIASYLFVHVIYSVLKVD